MHVNKKKTNDNLKKSNVFEFCAIYYVKNF